MGDKDYELKDHLGNVRVVVSDEKLIVDNNSNNSIDNNDDFIPNVKSYISYYPFGMKMPGAQYYAGGKPRYDFNGKETDQETGLQDYGMRIYDGRIAKFLSVDPLWQAYPWYTPYQFAGNGPIRYVDLDGAEEMDYSGTWTPYIKPYIYKGDVNDIPRFLANCTGIAIYNSASALINAGPASYKHITSQNSSISADVGELYGNIDRGINKQGDYFRNTSGEQIAKDALNSFTNIENYELPTQVILGEYFFRIGGKGYFKNNPAFNPQKQFVKPIVKQIDGLPNYNSIFSLDITTRGQAERYATLTNYKGFINVNDLNKNNPIFDLYNNNNGIISIVDITTTNAQQLGAGQFYTKLSKLSGYSGKANNRVLQIYLPKGKYTVEQINKLKTKLDDYIKDFELNSTYNIQEIERY